MATLTDMQAYINNLTATIVTGAQGVATVRQATTSRPAPQSPQQIQIAGSGGVSPNPTTPPDSKMMIVAAIVIGIAFIIALVRRG